MAEQSNPEPREVEVCCVVLRALFNYLRYDARVGEGTLDPPEPKPIHWRRVNAAKSDGRPVKALFDLLDRDGETRLARTYDWINPDGSVANWGKRDPKWLLVGDEVWIPHRERKSHFCTTCRLYNERHGDFDPAPSTCSESRRTSSEERSPTPA